MAILDIRELPDNSTITADLVIIGGGMAGITLAREWAGKDKRVVILESGGESSDDATQDLYAGKGTLAADGNADLDDEHYVGHSRARFYGGSGNRWGGKCVPLDAADFAARPWLGDVGWPIGRADLQPFYDRACDILSIPHFDKDYSQPQHEGRPPLVMNEAQHITSLPRCHTKVTGNHRIEFDEFRFGFTDAANISVYLHANVVRFDMKEDGKTLGGVGVATLDGKTYNVRCKKCVLACGGIENARLLLVANSRGETDIGKRSDAIGRYFQGHTVVSADRSPTHTGTRIQFTEPPDSMSLYVDRQPDKTHAVLGSTKAGQQHYDTAAFTVTMGLEHSPAGEERAIHTIAARVDRASPDAKDGKDCWCYFMTENLPNPDSRVSLAKTTDALGMPRSYLRWEYSKADVDHFERSIDAFARELGRSGSGRTACPIRRDELVASMSPSRHHMGTTRMHADPKQGVVDPDLRIHDTTNLFVAGSSVFPTSGIANPTLTILALTLRLSDHLKKELGE